MLEGPELVATLTRCGVTHVVWIPDSVLGGWDEALSSAPGLALVRACREGEALGVAAGLVLGGASPVVMMQCTGLFEAGDSLRNFVHDLALPIFMVVGVRNYYRHRDGLSADTAPRFAEAIVRTWEIPYVIFERGWSSEQLGDAYRQAREGGRPQVILLAE